VRAAVLIALWVVSLPVLAVVRPTPVPPSAPPADRAVDLRVRVVGGGGSAIDSGGRLGELDDLRRAVRFDEAVKSTGLSLAAVFAARLRPARGGRTVSSPSSGRLEDVVID